MPGEALLIGIAQLAVVVAGFSAISSALVPAGSSWTPGQRIRLRGIVSTSFNVMFESLVPLVAYSALNDAHEALVLASAFVGIYATAVVTIRGRQFRRAGGVRARSTQLLILAGVGATLLFIVNALVFGSLSVFVLALCLQLSVAAISFYSLLAGSAGQG